MKDGRNESVLVAGLYTEWLSNMMAYRHQLEWYLAYGSCLF